RAACRTCRNRTWTSGRTSWPTRASGGSRRARERGGPMSYDLIVKNGMIVDGSGFPRYRGDVGVKGGRIAEIGHIRAPAETTIDADGQVVAPGVIALHTPYAPQPFWDRLCPSSIWHGVTTVLTGNCGLTLAPLRPEHRETMVATFWGGGGLPGRPGAARL